MHVVRLRILDQYRKRGPRRRRAPLRSSDTSGTSTAQIGGALQIVTASFVDTTLMPTSNHTVLWAKTRYVFVPEPGLVLLLASGVAGLALLGRHRLRR